MLRDDGCSAKGIKNEQICYRISRSGVANRWNAR